MRWFFALIVRCLRGLKRRSPSCVTSSGMLSSSARTFPQSMKVRRRCIVRGLTPTLFSVLVFPSAMLIGRSGRDSWSASIHLSIALRSHLSVSTSTYMMPTCRCRKPLNMAALQTMRASIFVGSLQIRVRRLQGRRVSCRASMQSLFPVGSGFVASRASWVRCGGRGSTACRLLVCAWVCSAW